MNPYTHANIHPFIHVFMLPDEKTLGTDNPYFTNFSAKKKNIHKLLFFI